MQLANFRVKYVPPTLVIQRLELIMQLNSAPLITDETVKGPSARPLNPTPTVLNFSTEISQKYDTANKEVIIIIKKALKVGMPLHCIISQNMSFNWVGHLRKSFVINFQIRGAWANREFQSEIPPPSKYSLKEQSSLCS